jgi:uncharacterized membrane protein YhaH (DUF805 family)
MMASTSQQAPAGARAPDEGWVRPDTALLALTATTLILLAAQFALAGVGAFTKITSPAADAYGAHMVLGIVIGALTWLIVAATLASRPARAHRRTVWLAVTMAILTIPVEPLLAEAGRHVPAVGALHALNGLAICALAGWLLAATRRRQANHRAGPGSHR